MFTGPHTEKSKKKIAQARKKYVGDKAPRTGAQWTDEQRIKYNFTVWDRQQKELKIKSFLIAYNEQWKEFQKQ